jgi:hypothetical protein
VPHEHGSELPVSTLHEARRVPCSQEKHGHCSSDTSILRLRCKLNTACFTRPSPHHSDHPPHPIPPIVLGSCQACGVSFTRILKEAFYFLVYISLKYHESSSLECILRRMLIYRVSMEEVRCEADFLDDESSIPMIDAGFPPFTSKSASPSCYLPIKVCSLYCDRFHSIGTPHSRQPQP